MPRPIDNNRREQPGNVSAPATADVERLQLGDRLPSCCPRNDDLPDSSRVGLAWVSTTARIDLAADTAEGGTW